MNRGGAQTLAELGARDVEARPNHLVERPSRVDDGKSVRPEVEGKLLFEHGRRRIGHITGTRSNPLPSPFGTSV